MAQSPVLPAGSPACNLTIVSVSVAAPGQSTGSMSRTSMPSAGGRALPGALLAKPEDAGLEAVHRASPGSVARNVDELGVHDQLQQHRQQSKPG